MTKDLSRPNPLSWPQQTVDDLCSGGLVARHRMKGEAVDMSHDLVCELIERVRLLEHLVGQLRSENRELREALRVTHQQAV